MVRMLLVLLLIIGVAAPAQARHVVMVSIDGLKPDYYLEADRLGLKIPTLRMMMAGGSYARAVEPVMPAVTFPNHTTMATGVRPLKHGIASNLTVDWRGSHKGEWHWYAEDIRVTPLWEAVHQVGGKSATISWPATVGASSDYNIPEYHRYGLADDVKLMRVLSRPEGLLDEVLARAGGFKLDPLIETAASHIFARYAPELTMVHFLELDGAQHRHGPFSPEAHRALERIDALLGRLWSGVRARASDATLVVVSDHGFTVVDRQIEAPVLLKRGGFGPEVYPLPVAGFCALYVSADAPKGTGKRLEAYLRGVGMKEIAQVWSRADLDRAGAFPGALLALEAADGHVFGNKTEGEVVVPIKKKGVHGLRPDRPDQQASFLAVGDGIRQGVIVPRMRMIDVAPTVAALLGVRLPQAEGRVIEEVLSAPARGGLPPACGGLRPGRG